MRSVLALTTSSLAALLLACMPTRADPASGWVDPPAKTGAARSDASKPQAADPTKEAAKSADTSADPDAVDSQQAAAPRDHRRVERVERRERRQERRRMAVSSEIDTTAPDPRFGGWAAQAQRLTGDYLDSVSAPNGAMLAAAPRFYGDRVRFHGRPMSISALMSEKRRFVRRWPERRYAPQDGTMRTACNAAGSVCVVRTVMAFSAGNPARGVRSEGLSELSLTVSFTGERPVIVSESSRVLRRGSAALSSDERGRHGGA
ncbi:hypothetical protein [Methylobacterium haplocladii]|uniref:Lipoprotein n=1 Tax=Methylobacterium haplocladii TaxID=1176176 RepID=A0A512INR1_9HYPH|nr:hypothetical protein [Methylobacterium haplocladii]GEO99349.1 hypothetical protein MHA02_17370 [Methylobacterium haplocladii]GJD83449.1 hypothetical protein HPGCJGGD_1316 [Methylobacterium haplocladii]GLS60374.1 hypothetical protein GCM10007887_30530 [Methylobacterium haplocladii]